jgi:hypothetical protein
MPELANAPPAILLSELTDRLVAELNELLTADPIAVQCLIDARYPANQALADSPFVVVREEADGRCLVGPLGLLNGLLLGLGARRVAARYDDDTECLVGFEVYQEPKAHADAA